MERQILHTPEGLRDIYGIECERKLALERKLQDVFRLYGYQDIQTPMFEFFDVFGKEIGTIPSKELYKFFDREGNTLVLRPDITPSIARVAAAFFDIGTLPVRLCYTGNIFINHSSYQGRLRESTQLGAEMLGVDSAEADAEMVALAAGCLKNAGLENFQIYIGNVDFFESLMADAGLDANEEVRLRELIANRNYFGVAELFAEKNTKPETKQAFQTLSELVGGIEIMKAANEIAPSQKAKNALKRLEATYELLVSYGVEQYVTFDLSMSGTYGYYSGIIFRGYTYGTGDAIIRGGRYDHLLEKFGKAAPSIGFAIVLDELMNACSRQKIELPYACKNICVLYEEEQMSSAIALVKEFREQGRSAVLMKKRNGTSVDDYVAHAKESLCSTMVYLKQEDEIVWRNLLTEEIKVVRREELV